MEIIVTIGTGENGEYEEHVFEAPMLTYVGVETVDASGDDNVPGTGRKTILRVPFHTHGKSVHTICLERMDEVRQVIL